MISQSNRRKILTTISGTYETGKVPTKMTGDDELNEAHFDDRRGGYGSIWYFEYLLSCSFRKHDLLDN